MERAVMFPNSAQSALACIENFLILSVSVFLTNQQFEVCTSGNVSLRSTGFHCEIAAQPPAQCQIAECKKHEEYHK
jgi:hypothetical protein